MSGHGPGASFRVGFVLEHHIGHVTFAKMLERVVARDPGLVAEWFFFEPEAPRGPLARASFMRNYTLQGSYWARRSLRPARRFDVIFFHTQTLSLLSGSLMKRVATVISTDATPKNCDEVTAWHAKQAPLVEEAKRRAISSLLRKAAFVMPWSDWCARSVVDDYGVPPGRCHVIRPGVDLSQWGVREHTDDRSLRVLFVGNDFARKGGPELLEALQRLSADWECDIVTRTRVAARPGIRVHTQLQPGDPELRKLYANADVFVLPTRGDTMGWVFIEAMAAGLPVVATRHGAIPELVKHGQTGYLVQGVADLSDVLGRLAANPQERRVLGRAGRERACELYDEKVNGPKLVELIKLAAGVRA